MFSRNEVLTLTVSFGLSKRKRRQEPWAMPRDTVTSRRHTRQRCFDLTYARRAEPATGNHLWHIPISLLAQGQPPLFWLNHRMFAFRSLSVGGVQCFASLCGAAIFLHLYTTLRHRGYPPEGASRQA